MRTVRYINMLLVATELTLLHHSYLLLYKLNDVWQLYEYYNISKQKHSKKQKKTCKQKLSRNWEQL